MQSGKSQELSKRERQIMDAVYRLGSASAQEIRDLIANPPTYTAVRTLLTILEEKGHLSHELDGPRYVYTPVVPVEEMGRAAITNVLRNFFQGSVEKAVATLLSSEEASLSPDDLESLSSMIEKAKQEGK